jgi:hypothetical protein
MDRIGTYGSHGALLALDGIRAPLLIVAKAVRVPLLIADSVRCSQHEGKERQDSTERESEHLSGSLAGGELFKR